MGEKKFMSRSVNSVGSFLYGVFKSYARNITVFNAIRDKAFELNSLNDEKLSYSSVIGFVCVLLVGTILCSCFLVARYLLDIYRFSVYPDVAEYSILFLLAISSIVCFVTIKHFNIRVSIVQNRIDRLNSEISRDFVVGIAGCIGEVKGYSFQTCSSDAENAIGFVSSILTIISPVMAIWASGYRSFFMLERSLSIVARSWGYIVDKIGWFCNFVSALDWKRKTALGALAIASTVGGYWFYTRSIRKRKRRSALVPRKKQIISDEVPNTHGAECDPMASYSVVLPDSPLFSGVDLVYKSLVKIHSSLMIATAFRVGQNLVTAGHCLTFKVKGSNERGIWIINPIDRKYYWAPLEKTFRRESSTVLWDSVAVCSLPNDTSNYFSSLNSLSLVIPQEEKLKVGTFILDPLHRDPRWSFASGKAKRKHDSHGCVDKWVLETDSSLKPGSSGGPVMNQNGSIVGVSYAETQNANFCLTISDDLIDFLRNGGGAPQKELEVESCSDEYDSDCSSTGSVEESSDFSDQDTNLDGPGPSQPKNSRGKKSKNTDGVGPKDRKRKRKSQKERERMKKKKHPKHDQPEAPPGGGQIPPGDDEVQEYDKH